MEIPGRKAYGSRRDEDDAAQDPDLADFSLLTHSARVSTSDSPTWGTNWPASMADWSVSMCADSIHSDSCSTPKSTKSTPVRIIAPVLRNSPNKRLSDSPEIVNNEDAGEPSFSDFSAMLESISDGPSCLTASWVNLPPHDLKYESSDIDRNHFYSQRETLTPDKTCVLSEKSVLYPVLENDKLLNSELCDSSSKRNSRTNRDDLDRTKHDNNDIHQFKYRHESPVIVSSTFDEQDDIVALNSWNDINDERFDSPCARANNAQRTVVAQEAPVQVGTGTSTSKSVTSRSMNLMSDLFTFNTNSDRSTTRQNDRIKFKDKFLSKLSMKYDPSPTKTLTERIVYSPHKTASSSENSHLARVPLHRDGGRNDRFLVTGDSQIQGQRRLYQTVGGPYVESSENIRSKLQSAWNNVKYGWTMKGPTHFSDEKPLFMLGKCYHCKIDESISHESPIRSIDKFRQEFESRLWFTYRRDFPPVAGSNLTTDCGWGCMLRSGQMMLAQAFVLQFLGRDWNWYGVQQTMSDRYHRQIVKWFLDSPSTHCPFSIHNLVKYGMRAMNKKPGDWFGPASIALLLGHAMETAPELHPILENICCYVATDCTLYIQDILDLCERKYRSATTRSVSESSGDDENSHWRAVVILIPVRLGGEVFNSIYTPCLKNMLSQDWCLGIIGGKPKHSLFFVGWQDDKLVYLDPHYCQDSINMNDRHFPLHTYHCISPRKIAFSKMDPSCTIGFYCKTREDFDQFVMCTREAVSPPLQKAQYPMFVFEQGRVADLKNDIDEEGILELHSNSFIQSTHSFNTSTTTPQDNTPHTSASSYRPKAVSRTSEDFVFL